MTSYSFSFSSPWWFILLCGIAAAALSWYAYRVTLPPVARTRRYTLMALRTAALWGLLFVIFEPIINIVRATEEAPRAAILLDNSESMALQDASRNRKNDYLAALEALRLETLNEGVPEALSTITLFDNESRTVAAKDFQPVTSLNFSGQFTNISKALNSVFADATRINTQAVVLITDGAFNDGENPLYAAEALARPIFVVGVGDSTAAKDVLARSLLANEVGYLGSELPVGVTIQTSGFEQGTLKVILRDNGEAVAEQTIVMRGAETRSVPFVFTPKYAGMRTISAEVVNIKGFENEITVKNNTVSEFVNILKNKRKTLLLAGRLTPDISFVRSTLEENKNVECAVYVEGADGAFLDDAPASSGAGSGAQKKRTAESFRADANAAESVVLIGFPVATTNPATLEVVKNELARGKPVLFIASQELDWNRLRPLEPYLPFSVIQGSRQEMLALPNVKREALSSSTMKLSGMEEDVRAWNSLPPIFRTETLVRVKPEAEVLATIRLNNTPLNEPLILQRALGNAKSLAILGYGLYRWKLLGYAAESAKGRDVPDIFGTFFENGLRWLSTGDQGKFVRIKSTKKSYASGESVELTGQVYDRSYNPLDNADVRATLQSASLRQAQEVVLAALGGGRYAATVEGLGEGEYSFVGKAVVNSQEYGEDFGRFSVGKVNIEYQNLQMNVGLLRRIAERSGGKFYTAEEIARNPDALRRDIRASPYFQPLPVTLRSGVALWNYTWALAAIIMLFSLEWFLRKRSGMI